MDEEGDYSGDYYNDLIVKLRDIEEKQRMLKDRLLLLGENLIEMREKNKEDVLEIRKDIETMKRGIQRLVDFLESASEQFSTFAKKEDIEILRKQAKMFQPLEFVRKKDLKKLRH